MANSSQSGSDRAILQGVGEELKSNPPKILAKTRRSKGPAQANRQRVAILLSKARKAGAHVPAKSKGRHK